MSRALYDAAKAGNLEKLEAALAAEGVDLEYAPPVRARSHPPPGAIAARLASTRHICVSLR